MTSHVDKWYLFWYKWKEKTRSYTLVASICYRTFIIENLVGGCNNPLVTEKQTNEQTNKQTKQQSKQRSERTYGHWSTEQCTCMDYGQYTWWCIAYMHLVANFEVYSLFCWCMIHSCIDEIGCLNHWMITLKLLDSSSTCVFFFHTFITWL